MKKRTLFFTLLSASLLFESLLSFKNVFKKVKADDQITITFIDLYNNGNRNVIDLVASTTNDIQHGWDVEKITQVSADAFTINGNQTIDDGKVAIQKTAAKRYELCIDAINWSKYNYSASHEGAKCIKENDVVKVGGTWETSTGKNIVIPEFSMKWTNDNWEVVFLDYQKVETSFYRLETNNQNGFYLYTKNNNDAVVDDWNTRFYQVSEDAVILNGQETIKVSGNSKGQMVKVTANRYYFGLNDINYSTLQNNRQVGDTVILQNIFRYCVSTLSDVIDIEIEPLRVKWDGENWILDPFNVVELDFSYLEGNAKQIDVIVSEEDVIPYNDHWHERLSQADATCISINGVNKEGAPMIKATAYRYIFYLGDIPNYVDAVKGDVVVIKGLWIYSLGLAANVKEISFTYNENGWLYTFIYNALEKLYEYRANFSFSSYSSDGQAEINQLFEDAINQTKGAENEEEAESFFDELLTNIAMVKTLAQELEERKEEAKAELDTYKNAEDYREAEQQQMASIISEGKAAIDEATTIEKVEEALNTAKAALDALKTNAQYEEEEAAAIELAAYKERAITALTNYYNTLLETNKYDEAGKAALKAAFDEAIAAINAATDKAGVDAAVTAGQAALEAVEQYVEPTSESEPGETSESEPVTPSDSSSEQQPAKKGGCGGSIAATSIILSMLAVAGVAVMASKKRKED